MAHHLKDRHADSWDRFSVYLTIGDSHLRELESLILRIVKPPGNKQKGKFAKSEDIRRRFGREVRARMRRQLGELLGRSFATSPPRPRQPEPESNGRKPALADYITGPMKLRTRFKGQTITARVRRDGTIRLAGRKFSSPSLAAAFACHRGTCNGWTFWQYERAPGDWVVLDKLRK